MATVAPSSCVERIGITAGVVWAVLSESGPLSMTRLVKAVGAKPNAVMQAVGWLAREDKIWIDEEGRTQIVSLR